MSSPLARVAIALAALCALPALAEDDPISRAPALEPELLVREVLARNPGAAAAQAAAEAAVAKQGQAGALPDPMLSLEVAPLSIAPSQIPFGGTIELSQRLPFPGKRGLEREAAGDEARAVHAEAGEVRLALIEAARMLYADAWATARAQEINDAHRVLLRELKRSAEALYGAGMGSQQDALQAEVMIAELEQERVELDTRAAVLRSRLNALLHRSLNAALPPLPRALPGKDEFVPVKAEEWARRPSLQALEARVARSEAMVRLAQKAWLPDLEVMASYSSMWMEPEQRLMVGVGVELPVQQARRRAEQDEAAAEAKRMRLERMHLGVELSAEADQAQKELAAAVRTLALQRDRVLPAARAQLESARAGYVSGKGAFQSLVEAERGLRSAELKLYLATAEEFRRHAALERVLGRIPEFLEVSR